MGCIKKGGKGISHPRGEFLPMGCVKKGGSGDGWSRERTQKGFPTHGGSARPWQEGWERDFPPTGCVKSKKKPQPFHNGWGFF